MPVPLLSVIVPYHNKKVQLPRLLDSVLAQSLRNLEVILVDDCSDQPCEDIVESYLNKDLDLRLVAHSRNMGAKDARLTGVKEARGKILAFADADDLFLGEEVLARHAARLIREEADILHFNVVERIPETGRDIFWAWCSPFAPALEGQDILRAFVRQRRASSLVARLYARELWLKFLAEAQTDAGYRATDNVCLSTFAFAHARRYIGSEAAGYYYFRTPEVADLRRSETRIKDFGLMRRNFVPYLARLGIAADILDGYDALMAFWIAYYKKRQVLAGKPQSTHGNA